MLLKMFSPAFVSMTVSKTHFERSTIDQGFPYNRREGGFELLNLALYSQSGGISGTF